MRRRRHLVHQGRVLVFVAVLSISSVLLSVRVSDFVLFCILGFLVCILVGLDLLHLALIVGIVVLLSLYILLSFVVCFDCFLRCNFRRCLDCVLTFCLFASSSSRYFAVSWTFSIILDWRKDVFSARNVEPVLELFHALHHLLVHAIMHLTECGLGLWYSSRAADSSHSSFPAGFQRRHCENCVIRIELVRIALVGGDAFPDGRGELWVTSLATLARCGSTPAATAVLNSWNSVSCLKISLFPSIILAFNVWSTLC